MTPEFSHPLLSVVPSRLTPTEFSAADYLQLGCANRRTLRVELTDGYIEMSSGQLHGAYDSDGTGMPALLRLLTRGGLTGATKARCFEAKSLGDKNLDVELETRAPRGSPPSR